LFEGLDGSFMLFVGKKKRDEVVDSGNSFGFDGGWLRPIPSMKNVALSDKKFYWNNVKSIPEYFKNGWWEAVVIYFDVW
jgi:hypothetical protein